jgi:hypothetical protein
MLLPPMERRAILRDIELRVPLHLTEITGAKPWDRDVASGGGGDCRAWRFAL